MELNETIVVPVLIAIVELFKGLGLQRKFAGVVALILGLMFGIFYLSNGDLKVGVMKGIIYGLTASGLYSNAKNTYQHMRNRRRSI